MPGIIKLKFIESCLRAREVKSFRFKPVVPFEFKPGQFAKILFDENDLNNKQLNKYLSFSLPPGGNIEFTKKLSQSIFSQKLNSLKKGDELAIQGPLGNCIFKDEYKKILFLIGGIGITPVISILGHIVLNKLAVDSILFYSNKTLEQAAFYRQLNQWQKNYPKLKVFNAITSEASGPDIFLHGHINCEIVAQYVKDIRDRIVFIFGPPAMVEAMVAICRKLDLSPEAIKKENFIGY